MDHKRWMAGLLALALCFGLLDAAYAETRLLYEKVKEELSELRELEKTFIHTVEVQPGDTIYQLAKQYGTDVKTIALANDLHDPSVIQVGEQLRVPKHKGFFYEVKKGETLESIAKSYGVSVADIKEINPSLAEDALASGDELFLKEPKHWPKPDASGTQLASRHKNETDRETASAASSRSLLGHFTLTAYTAGPESTGKSPGHPAYGITASGKKVQPGVTVAADPNVIPLGSTVYIEGIGQRVVHDTGGAIKGNKIDVYIPDLSEARRFGVKNGVKVYVVND